MQAGRLPKRFPVGTKYIVEGKSRGEGEVQIFSRYLIFPDGRCFDLPSDSPDAGAIARQHRHDVAGAKKY